MKRVIRGKIYNTATAELLHDWSNGYPYSDFAYCRKSLYKTKNGAYFIAGCGGAKSEYAECYGNSVSGGEGIEIIQKDDAVAWLEDHKGEEALEKYFASELEEG